MSGFPQTPGFGKAAYASSDTPEKLGTLGELASFDGVLHRLMQLHTVCVSDVIASGHVLYRTATANVVTNDRSEAVTDSANNYCGIAPQLTASVPESTATVTYYMWVQISGRATVVTNGDDDIVAGDLIIASGDGTCDSVAALSENAANFIGIAAAADVNASDTVVVDLRPV